LKYDNNGNLIWDRDWNTPTHDSDYVSGGFYTDESLQIDGDGNIIIMGTSSNPYITFKEDIVTVKYDSSGNVVWSNIFNGSVNDEDRPYSLALDLNGNAYICGYTAHSPAIGAIDWVTFKINGITGLQEWEETFDGIASFYDEAHAITVDSLNNVYVTGWNATNNDPFNLMGEMMTIKYTQTPTGLSAVRNFEGKIFPVPCDKNLNIELSATLTDYSISIFNFSGKLVRYIENISNHHLEISTTDLVDGIYFFSISGKENFSGKFTVVH
jgi:hypothetical protein